MEVVVNVDLDIRPVVVRVEGGQILQPERVHTVGRDVYRLVLYKTLLENGLLGQDHILTSQSIQDPRILHALAYQLV